MLGNIAIILLIVWAVAMVSAQTLSGWIYILVAVAAAAMLIHVAQRRRTSREEWKRADKRL